MDTLVRSGAILLIYDELYFWEQRNLINHILTRHEQGAIHAVDSYARVTRQVGICMATSGPGTTNLITRIANAQMDSIPIFIITGQVTTNFIGTDIFGITLPIIKHSYKIIDPKEICIIIFFILLKMIDQDLF